MKKIVTIIFSRNRALQLDLCLRTLQLHCKDIHKLSNVNVLYRADDNHKPSYEILKTEYPKVNFVEEVLFKEDLLKLVHDKSSILFCVDDTIFTEDFLLSNIVNDLNNNPDCLGFSLRLGKNTSECFPMSRKQQMPNFISIDKDTNKYNWCLSDGDFAYPLELSSSFYRLKDIDDILYECKYFHPNSLEDALYANLFNYVLIQPNILCFKKSVAFSVPLNKVQTTNIHNRSGNDENYLPDNLMKLYMSNFRIQDNKFNHYVNSGCHEMVDVL